MNARPADRLAIALAQLNPIVGRFAGNADRARCARAKAAIRRRRPGACSPSSSFAAIRPKTLSSSRRFKRPAGDDREARQRDRRWRPGDADRHAMGRGRQAFQRHGAARQRACRGAALQGRSAELRRVRRKARVYAGAFARPDKFPRHEAWDSDLRGHLGAGAGRMHCRDRRRNLAGRERFAIPAWCH